MADGGGIDIIVLIQVHSLVISITYHRVLREEDSNVVHCLLDAVQCASPSLLIILSMPNRFSGLLKLGKKKKKGSPTSAPQPSASVSTPAASSTPVRMP
jgi:hypothetical protein